MLEDQGRLSTLEPRLHVAVLALTLVTATRRLAIARRRTTTFPYTLVVGPLVVAEVGEDGCAPRLRRGRSCGCLLYRERGEQGRERGARCPWDALSLN